MRVGAASSGTRISLATLRRSTAEHLRARRQEIHEAVVHRALSVAPPSGKESPGYVEALRAAIPAAVEHAFEVIEVGEERLGPTPTAILVQAAASARNEVGLEVVMRRYAAGYSTLSDFLHQEIRAVAGDGVGGYLILQRDLTALFDRFVVEVGAAYRCEEERSVPSPRLRRVSLIRRLLVGELVDTAALEYPLEAFHLAIIVSGPEPEATAIELARRTDRRLLVAEVPTGRLAIWLGGPRPLEAEELEEVTGARADGRVRLSLGEPGFGLGGWRRSRRQAEAAYLVALRGEDRVVRYRDIALLAAAVRDEDLSHHLAETYLTPLGDPRTGLLETLTAFFGNGRNVSSAAAALGLSRQTVASRLQAAERRLGRPLAACGMELEAALRLTGLLDRGRVDPT